MKLLLHESQEVIAKIELAITSELGSLDIVDTVEEGRELTVHKTQNYEKVLERQRTNKWRKREVKEKGKQKIMSVLDEILSSKNTGVLNL